MRSTQKERVRVESSYREKGAFGLPDALVSSEELNLAPQPVQQLREDSLIASMQLPEMAASTLLQYMAEVDGP